MDGKPRVIAWMMGEEIADDDPRRAIKLRALDLDAAAEILGQVTREADIRARAAAIGQVVEALAIESIDIGDVLDASGLDERGREDAAYLALSLKLAELSGPDDGE
jgi:hypothetical protein